MFCNHCLQYAFTINDLHNSFIGRRQWAGPCFHITINSAHKRRIKLESFAPFWVSFPTRQVLASSDSSWPWPTIPKRLYYYLRKVSLCLGLNFTEARCFWNLLTTVFIRHLFCSHSAIIRLKEPARGVESFKPTHRSYETLESIRLLHSDW